MQPPGALPLSVIHADALYRPVAPVEYDDEGYPVSDGRVSESTLHGEAAHYAFDALRVWFLDRPDTLVVHDLPMLFEEGDPNALLSPDSMVVFGVGNHNRISYKVWREGHVMPSFALELLPKRTWRRDFRVKPPLYAALGVSELVLFEPWGLELAGFASDGAGYAKIPALPDGGLPSRVLGLDVVVDERRLRFRNPETGDILPDHLQLVAMVESERRLAKARARAADAEARDYDAETEAEKRRTEVAEARADRAERRVAELEALLERSRSPR